MMRRASSLVRNLVRSLWGLGILNIGFLSIIPFLTAQPSAADDILIDNLVSSVYSMEAPKQVENWMVNHLQQADRAEGTEKKSTTFYQAGRQLFMMKHAGVYRDGLIDNGEVTEKSAETETLLDIAMASLNMNIGRHEGYRGLLEIVDLQVEHFPEQGDPSLHIKMNTTLKPTSQHRSNSGKKKFGLVARYSIVNTNLETIRTKAILNELPDKLEGPYTAEVDFVWDGRDDDGMIVTGPHFISLATDYVAIDPSLQSEIDDWMDNVQLLMMRDELKMSPFVGPEGPGFHAGFCTLIECHETPYPYGVERECSFDCGGTTMTITTFESW